MRETKKSMDAERNSEARRLLMDSIEIIEEEDNRLAKRRRTLETQTTRNRQRLEQVGSELTGLRQALDALGGPLPEEDQG